MQGRKNWPISSINTIVLNLLSLQTEAEVSTNVPGRCVSPTMGDNQCIPSERRTNQENSQSAHAHLNENLPTMESAESWIIVHMCVLHRKIQHKDTERCKIIPIQDALEQISILKGKSKNRPKKGLYFMASRGYRKLHSFLCFSVNHWGGGDVSSVSLTVSKAAWCLTWYCKIRVTFLISEIFGE